MAAYINEIHFAPLFGSTAEDQYVELRSDAGSSFSAGTYLVAIGSADGVHELGDIHTIFNLSNQSFGSNGMLVLMQSAAGYTVDPASRSLKGTDGFVGLGGNIFSADATNAKQVRTGSNTFLLIRSNVAPSLTDDIDGNDDGVPDGAYSNWTVLDGVSVFPRVESIWPQRGYAPIAFREVGVGQVMPGTISITTDQLAYVGRIGQSTGYAATDWVAGNTVEVDNGSGSPSWRFQLQHGVFGTPRPYAFGGRFLDHVGAPNWVGSVGGTVFGDLNSDGIQQASELPIAGVTVLADVQGDFELGFNTERIEPNNYAVNSDVSNISSNVTLVSAGSNNVHQGFKVRPVQRFGAPVGEFIFSHENVGFFNENRRLRIDFYRPAKSISIDVIGNSDFSPTYGRLEIFDATGTSLGFVRSAPLSANQTQRLSISSLDSNIAWAVAYSEDSFLASSPFGMLDNLTFTLPEQTTVSDAQGRYTIQPMSRGSYSIRVQTPTTYDQVFPAGNTAHDIVIDKYDNFSGVNFGLLGELPPILSDQTYNISEALAAGAVIATLPIAKGYPSQLLNAAIISGDPDGLFAIDANTGRLTLTRSELDFENKPGYTLQIKLEDKANSALNDTASIQLIVDDANEAPVVATQSKTISENSAAQTLVATMAATDPDAGPGAQVTWSIAGGNAGGAFVVDPTTGRVSISDASKIDFEKASQFNLVLRATDGGAPPSFGEGLLVVNLTNVNEPPVLALGSFSIKENSQAGAVVGSVIAIDPDANQALHWEISGGSGVGLFEIGADDAKITVASGAALDFESNTQYDLVVTVSDNGSPSLLDARTYTISVQNENDSPLVGSSQFELAENSPAGSVVGVLTGTDQDDGQNLTYSISDSDAAHFVIDVNSGQLQVAPNAQLNFESKPTLGFTLTVTDNGLTPKSSSALVTISLKNVNEPPTLVSNSFSVGENSPVGTKAGTLAFFDPDDSDVVGFEIIEQLPAWFSVDSTTGELIVASGAAIDFEGTNQSVMKVLVSDRSGSSSLGTVTITASNRNDPPSLAGSLSNSSATPGAPFAYTLPANSFVDQDAGDALRLFATNASGFPLPSWLSFNAQTGVLSGTPSVDDAGTLQVRITAVDSSNAAASTDFAIDVQLNPFPWSNPTIPLDVSDDGIVSAKDALLVINYINTIGSISVEPGAAPTAGLLDTNRDNSVSAIDALLIINEINLQAGGGEGEAEATSRPEEIVWAWDFHQSSSAESNALDINRRRRDEVIELLALARHTIRS